MIFINSINLTDSVLIQLFIYCQFNVYFQKFRYFTTHISLIQYLYIIKYMNISHTNIIIIIKIITKKKKIQINKNSEKRIINRRKRKYFL